MIGTEIGTALTEGVAEIARIEGVADTVRIEIGAGTVRKDHSTPGDAVLKDERRHRQVSAHEKHPKIA